MDVAAGRSDALARGRREVLRGEAPIEADDNAAVSAAVLDDPLRDRLRADADRVEGVLVGDTSSPAVGAEDDIQTRAPCRVETERQWSSVSRSESASATRGDHPVFWRKRVASSAIRAASLLRTREGSSSPRI